MSTPPSDPPQPDETTAQYPASPPAPPPGELSPPAPPAWELPPAGSQPSQAAPTGAGQAPPPPPPFPPFPPQAPPAAAAPPPPPAAVAVAERREPSLVQRTLPLAIAAILGGAVAGGIVAVADGLRDDPTVVVERSSPAAGTGAGQATPAAPAPTTPSDPQTTPTDPQGATPGGETAPDQGGEAPAPASNTWLGIEPTPVDGALADRVRLQAESGVMVGDVVPDSPADEAGFQRADARITIDGQEYAFGGDIITAIDGEPVRSVDDLRRIIGEHQPGDSVQVQVVHPDGQPETYEVTLDERPQDESQAAPEDPEGSAPDTLPGDFGAPDPFQAPDGFPQDG